LTFTNKLAPLGKELDELVKRRLKILKDVKDSELHTIFSKSIDKFRNKRLKLGALPNAPSRFDPFRPM
jgi:hypothetical protein